MCRAGPVNSFLPVLLQSAVYTGRPGTPKN